SLKVEVPTKLLEETAKKRIGVLERKVKSLEGKLNRSLMKVAELETEKRLLKEVYSSASVLVQDVKDAFNLRDDEPWA
ncbi:unnamed protein product, partial [marine sediment metagenome]